MQGPSKFLHSFQHQPLQQRISRRQARQAQRGGSQRRRRAVLVALDQAPQEVLLQKQMRGRIELRAALSSMFPCSLSAAKFSPVLIAGTQSGPNHLLGLLLAGKARHERHK